MKKPPLTTPPAVAEIGNEKPEADQERDAPKKVDESYLQQLEEENRRLKMAVADLTLRNQALKLVVGKKW
ncbi:hypothetical protein [Sulfuritalea sp.]|uniref:hypothetical protein n=1 Tax=Sulfuritalea sp. TaxID=2480090 RepID=UPI001AC08F37|nr:hypothetical protein [Sulfuritalea sp.]MBN8475181.1 hypothetical protein [Sulfuritalea sp.]